MEKLGEAGGAVGDLGSAPAAELVKPAGNSEVVDRDVGHYLGLEAGVDHAAVMVPVRVGELPILGLEPAPLQAESVAGQTESGQDCNVLP